MGEKLTTRQNATFAALILAQILHSIEEYLGRLWESFPPAAFVSGLVSTDHRIGFIVMNIALVMFGLWCLLVPVRRDWSAAPAVMWGWIALETANGIGHVAWSLYQRGYTPGLLTAPILLVAASYLAIQLRTTSRSVP
ncbi:MAG: HXXEE domain-containing protein [Gemmatimonadaceae bacterium]